MIIGENREAVIENIKQAIAEQDFYRKVEVNDPVLTNAETKAITDKYIRNRKKAGFQSKTLLARGIANVGSDLLNRKMEIVGDIDETVLREGAVITSNHFSPLENTIIRYWVRRKGFRKLNIVSQVTNFAMKGVIGYLMNYGDTIPLSMDMRYLNKEFLEVLKELTDRREPVLIYPEQEMWFNYRKPRPLKRGAYFFAASLHKPIVSCFVEMIDTEEKEREHFRKVKYRLHILGIIRPDESKGVKENSEMMCATDYCWKKATYEKVYGKPLTYDFEMADIAGWEPNPS